MSPKALITGFAGQDGILLARLLHSKGYEIHGLVREVDIPGEGSHLSLPDYVHIELGNISDREFLHSLLEELKPEEIYNFAAQSHVARSFQVPEITFDVNATGCLRLLESIRHCSPKSRVLQAASSEVFGLAEQVPQTELTPFGPRNPYGISKAAAAWTVSSYRDHYGLFACSAILYNHESELRSEDFVTRKITASVARISTRLQKQLLLGNLDAGRDWGCARDYVRAMWLMLQQDVPEDFLVATGTTHTVREFCSIAFEHVDLDYRDYVAVDPNLLRPADVNRLVGDASKARNLLGWKTENDFANLVKMMVDADLRRITAGRNSLSLDPE